MRRPYVLGGGLVVAVAVVAGVVVWQVSVRHRDDRAATSAARSFASAWQGGTLAAVAFDPSSGADPAKQVSTMTAGLLPGGSARPTVSVTRLVRKGDAATATLAVRWALPAAWAYTSTLPLRKDGSSWRPVLSPSVVAPQLAAGRVLRSRVVQAPRAAITDRTGTPIVQDRPVVTVGLQPSRTTDLAGTVAQLASVVDVDGAALLKKAQAAAPTAFVEAITLRREQYDPLRDRLQPIPGVVFQTGTRQLAPTSAFARALLGSVGAATADAVKASKGRLRGDETIGLSGLQASYDPQLGGTPGITVEEVDAGTAAHPVTLFSTQPTPGTPLQLTLDQTVQQAADAALTTLPAGKTGALVAVQPSTGDVLAVANNGPQGPGVDRALTGRYPPGSTFKIASSLALLRSGVTSSTTIDCPPTVTVSGKVFKNAEAEQLGPVPFSTDVAQSCNTAFVGSASRVTAAQVQQAASDLGYQAYSALPGLRGVGAYGASVPVPTDPVEHAADMIGQGQVLTSPLAVAVSAATVASGSLHLPRLLSAVPASTPAAPLAQAPVLQQLLRQVVTSGTGTALLQVPGDPVSGKTGTAEFGAAVPPPTHAWFAGFSGDLAFAVIVEDGGFGGDVAAPVAARFLTDLRS